MEDSKTLFPIKVKEERTINRITLRGVVNDAVSAFNIERGLVFTIKLLFSKPGYLLNLYLHDGRFRIFNAFRLLLLTTAVSLFTLYLIGAESFFEGFSEGFNSGNESKVDSKELQSLFLDGYNLLLWIAIPIYALFSYLANRKMGYNYAEHIVMQTFQICAINMISMVFLIIVAVTTTSWVTIILLLASVGYYLWILSSWLGKKSIWFFIKNTLVYLVANIFYISISLTVIALILID